MERSSLCLSCSSRRAITVHGIFHCCTRSVELFQSSEWYLTTEPMSSSITSTTNGSTQLSSSPRPVTSSPLTGLKEAFLDSGTAFKPCLHTATARFASFCPGMSWILSVFSLCFFLSSSPFFFLVVQGRLSARPKTPSSPLPSTRAPSYPEETLWRWKGWTVVKTKIATIFSMGARKIRFHRAGPVAAIEGWAANFTVSHASRWRKAHAPFPFLLLTGVYFLCYSLLDWPQTPLYCCWLLPSATTTA